MDGPLQLKPLTRVVLIISISVFIVAITNIMQNVEMHALEGRIEALETQEVEVVQGEQP